MKWIKMISSILDIGRTEGAQFEQMVNLDIVEYIKKKQMITEC